MNGRTDGGVAQSGPWHSPACNTLEEILSIPGDFSTSSETRALKTSAVVATSDSN